MTPTATTTVTIHSLSRQISDLHSAIRLDFMLVVIFMWLLWLLLLVTGAWRSR